MWRNFITAVRQLTRLPTGGKADWHIEPEPGVAAWYPIVGAALGVALALLLQSGGAIDFVAAALFAVVVRALVTGGRQLSALATVISRADLAPADTPAGPSPARHGINGSAAVAVSIMVVSQYALFELFALHGQSWWLPLIFAWAYFGPLMWMASLEPIATGGGERVGPAPTSGMAARWAVLLFIPCIMKPSLLAAPLAVILWRLYMKRAHGGHDAELVLAGIALVEIVALAAVTFASVLF